MTDLAPLIRKHLQQAQRILITSHIRPDGDAIGSTLALGLALTEAGKEVQMVLEDGVPAAFRSLPGSHFIQTRPNGFFDCIIVVDCSDSQRVGKVLDGYRPPDVVIDHHLTSNHFGKINLIDPSAAATASLLAREMPRWGLKITLPVAENLLTGMVTDTLGFRTSSTTPEILRQAADLLELGADLSGIYLRNLVQRTFAAVRYWGQGLAKLQRSETIVWTTLTLADREIAEYNGNDDADLINLLSAIQEAEVAIVLVEQAPQKTKISWRGLKPAVNVAEIARSFGGGGHKSAAGAEMQGSLEDIQQKVLAATRLHLQQIHDSRVKRG
ncbi:MAG: bifunctional oligoribonuclease/PAP phosphatase NrnA [Anaerolineales bacterium]|nr:bifunctional oligoribonuclease/PAP phosphatase NrnA [Anaerolineales bacterium]MCX7609752.1 bifunctional oligoribonuclease/PAP phosphatase NrnA [Anaerolineales bacterium]MDW8228162.1 bifunctional oligoribonuclease/PAP phosphatase NrnA [Anaerolineales bacterium]